MNKYYFTSDWHFGHENIQKGVRGKAFSSVEEHDATIKENIFKTVQPGSNLYFLGDAFWKWSSKQVEQFMTDLKKHKINLHWTLGNHDKASWTKFSCVQWAGQIKDVTIEKQPITLCHYPMLTWHRSHYNAWQLHGHIHLLDSTYNRMIDISSSLDRIRGKQLNMNVEFWDDFKPRSFEEVYEAMKLLPDNWDLIKR